MKRRKLICLFLVMVCCLVLCGCRTRTGNGRNGIDPKGIAWDANAAENLTGMTDDGESEPAEEQKKTSGEAGQTKENPEAARKEYDENAAAEILPGTDHEVHGEGDGSGSPVTGEKGEEKVSRISDEAEETAARTAAAEQAEKLGVSEDAKEADSAMTYYSVLLAERMSGLFECKRMNVYWETAEDHVTVFKTSSEHSMILNAGAYDVSARLLAENLRVDDGWVCRKNPDVIVKVVDRSILGSGATGTAAAKQVCAGLTAREGWKSIGAVRRGKVILISEEMMDAPHTQLAAMLAIARTAYPEEMQDTNPQKALEALTEEATGRTPPGIYFYSMQGGNR